MEFSQREVTDFFGRSEQYVRPLWSGRFDGFATRIQVGMPIADNSFVKGSCASLSAEKRIEQIEEICRGIRTAKLHFHKVIERYGSKYEGSANRFVDLAYFVSDLAAQYGNDDLKTSLKRHAEEIEKARSEAIDCQ